MKMLAKPLWSLPCTDSDELLMFETHFDDVVMSTIVFPLAAIACYNVQLQLAGQLAENAHEDSDYTIVVH